MSNETAGLPLFAEDVVLTAPYSNQTTSKAAAQAQSSETLKSKAKLVYDYILAQGERGATDEEVEDALKMSETRTNRPVRKGLWYLGYVVDSGRTRKTVSGNEAIVYVALADLGKAVPKPHESKMEKIKRLEEELKDAYARIAYLELKVGQLEEGRP